MFKMSEETFTKQMRKATREIHDVSDALVNAKLAFALSDSSVWAEGLLIFYEIFRYLDEAMDRLRDTHLGNLNIVGIRRTEAFETDLNHYLGEGWTKDYQPRESVAKYLLHLRKLEESDPDQLMAYVYHLYMGLLSGGQILKKKREMVNRYLPFSSTEAYTDAVTNFGEFRISELKRGLTDAMNSIADILDDSTKEKLIEESKKVFVLNNEIIKTVKGTTEVILRRLIMLIVVLLIIVILYYMLF